MWVSLNNGDGTFQAPQLVVEDLSYEAGGWRVGKHPRFLANAATPSPIPLALARAPRLDIVHIADIVGFGNYGVYVAVNNGDGTFQEPVFTSANFGSGIF